MLTVEIEGEKAKAEKKRVEEREMMIMIEFKEMKVALKHTNQNIMSMKTSV